MDSSQIFRGDTLFGRSIVFEIGESGGEGRLFSTDQGFDLEFDVMYDCSGEPPSASCTIYNPPREFGSFMRRVQSKSFVGISAGYGKDVTRLYAGNVVKDSIKFAKNDADWSILFECLSAGEKYRNKIYSSGDARSQTFEEVFRSAAAAAEVEVKALDLSGLSSQTMPRGRVYHGPAFRLMDQLAKMAKAQLVFDGNSVSLVRYDRGHNVLELVPRFTTEDGTLIGSPEEIEKGLSIKVLLTPEILPGQQIQVEYFDRFDGAMRTARLIAQKVKHTGNNTAGDFCTEIEGRLYEK
jgi:hypothetical protein